MIVRDAKQPNWGPKDKPLIVNPVKVDMNIALYYYTERGPQMWPHSVYCDKVFAETILTVLNDYLSKRSMGLVHIGIYNARKARHRDGTIITPERWSNHSYALAIDWKGVIDEFGNFLSLNPLHDKVDAIDAELLSSIWDDCRAKVEEVGRKPEFIHEHEWIHFGVWPLA